MSAVSSVDDPGDLDALIDRLASGTDRPGPDELPTLCRTLSDRAATLRAGEKKFAAASGAFDLDAERRREALAEAERRAERAREEADAREEEFAVKAAGCERLVGDLERQQAELAADRGRLSADRTRLAADRSRLEEESGALIREREAFEREQSARRDELEADWKRERAERQANLEATVTAAHRDEAETLARVRRELDERAADLDRDRAELERESADAREAFDRECADLRERFAAERTAAREEFERERSAARDRLERERDRLSEDRGEWEAEVAARDAEHAAALAAFAQEREVAGNRLEYRAAHLDRTRDELESARAAFAAAVQRARTGAVHTARTLDLRRRQLDRLRDLLDRRERSLDTAADDLRDARTADDTARRGEAQTARTAAEEWEAHTAELTRTLTDRTAAVDRWEDELREKEARLEEFRWRLDAAHRETLTLKVAAEELLPALREAAPAAPVALRLKESQRQVLHVVEQRTREAVERSARLDAARVELAKRAAELQRRRTLFDALLAEREGAARVRAERDAKRAESIAHRERLWAATRERWRSRSDDAERVIRDLLRQLEETVAGQNAVEAAPPPSTILLPTAAAPAARRAA